MQTNFKPREPAMDKECVVVNQNCLVRDYVELFRFSLNFSVSTPHIAVIVAKFRYVRAKQNNKKKRWFRVARSMLLQMKHDKYHVETVHICQAANNLPSIRFCQTVPPNTPIKPEFITKRKKMIIRFAKKSSSWL